MKRLLALLFTIAFISSCSFVEQQKGESEMLDTPPPANYNPNFIMDVTPIYSSLSKPTLEISSIDVSNPDKIKVYMHLIESGASFLSEADKGSWAKIWCEALDSSESTQLIKNLNVRASKKEELVPVAMALVVDHSGSMGSQRALTVQNALDKLINTKESLDKVSITKYDNKVITTAKLSSDKDELLSNNPKNALTGFGGLTATLDAIWYAIDEIKAEDKLRKVICVFSDGTDNSSKKTEQEVIEKAIKSGVQVCAFDYGYYTTPGLLKRIANATGGIHKHIYSTNELNYVFDDIYLRLYNYYILEFTPETYDQHKINLKICLPDTQLVATAYYNNIPQPGSINLVDVFFDTGKWTLKQESMINIKKLALLMQKNPKIKIELQGHTDNVGKADENLKLSERRANAVKEALVKMDIDYSRITTKGFGDTMPVADNSTQEGRAKNRRTQFIIQ